MTQDPDVETMARAGLGDAALGPGPPDGARKTLNAELKPATGGRVWRSWALRTQTAGSDAFAAAPPRSIMATRRATAINRAPIPKMCCNQTSAWSTPLPTSRSRPR